MKALHLIRQIFVAADHASRCAWLRLALLIVVSLISVCHVEGADAPKLLNVVAAPDSLYRFTVAVSQELCTNELACGGDGLVPSSWFITSDDGTSSLRIQSVGVEGTNVILVSTEPRITARIYRVGVSTNGIEIFDVSGIPIAPGSFVRTIASFQQGFGGYTNTQDTFLDALNPDTPQGASNTVSVRQGRLTSTSPVFQALLRFDALFGEREDQIPTGAAIKRATLVLTSETIDDTTFAWFPIHRMRADWNQTSATWNSFGGGIGYVSYVPDEVDPQKVEPALDNLIQHGGGFPLYAPWTGAVDVTISLKAWATGIPNRGWAIIPTDQDGAFDRYGFASSEHDIPAFRPRLEVDFVVPRLRVRSAANQRILEWEDTSFVLQSSVSLNPSDWRPVEGTAASGYVVPINDEQRFFRLCNGCP